MASSGSEAFLLRPDDSMYGMSDYYDIITKPMWLKEGINTSWVTLNHRNKLKELLESSVVFMFFFNEKLFKAMFLGSLS